MELDIFDLLFVMPLAVVLWTLTIMFVGAMIGEVIKYFKKK